MLNKTLLKALDQAGVRVNTKALGPNSHQAVGEVYTLSWQVTQMGQVMGLRAVSQDRNFGVSEVKDAVSFARIKKSNKL